ncbi:hydroxysteroid dehydrogenase [Xylogone sp. PMI_703]|nr:hydroxysteroid dehydrogenase [Xylogone sp. PMI_703]
MFCWLHKLLFLWPLNFFLLSFSISIISQTPMMALVSDLDPVLVVGGCGFLGNHIINELFRRDPSASISVLDMRITNARPLVSYYTADITQKSQVEDVFAKVNPKTVFHTVSPHPLQRDHQLLHKVNVTGTQNLVECAQQFGTKVFVYTSSTSVVHDHHSPLCNVTESLPVLFHPQQPEQYAHTKALAERIVLDANRVNNMLTVAIRPTTIYGEGDLLLTANLCRTAYTGRARNQLGDGKNLMDVTYAGNVAYAQILAARALISVPPSSAMLLQSRRVDGEAFFVRNNERYTFWEINRIASRIAGYPIKKEDIRVIPLWLIMIISFLSQWLFWIFTLGKKEPLLTTRVIRLVTIERTFSINKIEERLGYKAPYATEEGLERAIGWYMKEVYAEEKKSQ